MNWVSNRVVMDIRNELFGKLLNHSMDFYNKIRTGFPDVARRQRHAQHADSAEHGQQRRFQASQFQSSPDIAGLL